MKIKFALIPILFLFFSLLSSPLLARAQPATSRVINGTSSENGKWPWMASLSEAGADPRQGHFCGGVLIDSTHVLTAAHCVADFTDNPEALQVTVGRTRLSDSAGVTVQSRGFVIHPDYNADHNSNDLAIIRVEDTGINSYLLPASHDQLESWDQDSPATVMGWGYVDPYFPVRPDNLQEAPVPIVNQQMCADRIGIAFEEDSMICAGKLSSSIQANDGVDSCSGDSGGPLIVETSQGYRLAGIVSWGYACGSEKYWGVYTKVAKFHDWIQSKPAIAPYPRTAPSVKGRPEIGSTLTCQKGSWEGEEKLSFTYTWSDPDEGIIKQGSSPAYRLRRTDIGRSLICSVTAGGSSSETTVETQESGVIFPRMRRLTARNAARSAAETIGMVCDSKQCSLLVSIKNRPVRKVTAVSVGAGQNSIMGTKAVSGRRVTDNSWTFRIPRAGLRGSSLFIRIIFEKGRSRLLEIRNV